MAPLLPPLCTTLPTENLIDLDAETMQRTSDVSTLFSCKVDDLMAKVKSQGIRIISDRHLHPQYALYLMRHSLCVARVLPIYFPLLAADLLLENCS